MSTLTGNIRQLVVLLLVVIAGVGGGLGHAGPAEGQGGGGDTSAVAINTKDGSSLFKLAFQIRRVTGDVVNNQNAAVAYASCTQCQTVAISIQVLLIAGSPTVFTPQNVAIAINDQCTLCDTMALAYQFAVGMDTKLKFTAEGNRQLAELRRQLEDLRRSGLSSAEIQAKAGDIVSRLSNVLSTELVGSKTPAERAPSTPPDAQGGQQDGAAPATTVPDPSTGEPAPQDQTAPTGTNETTPPPTQTTPTDEAPTTTAPP